jgi:MFS transporter
VLVTLLIGRPSALQLALVAFVDSALWSLAAVTERGVFRALVPTQQLPRAIALAQGREAAASIVGPPLGGVLLAAGNSLPFAFDAISSLAAIVAVVRLRTPLTPAAEGRRTSAGFRAAVGHAVEGIRWVWRRPFMRDGALMYGAANLSLSALELLVLLVARHYGAGAGAIGVMFALMGLGGVLGALVAERVTAAISPRLAIALEPCLVLAITPLFLVIHAPLAIGALGVPVFLSTVLSSATVVSRRVALTPDELQGRVQAGAGLISSSLAWIGPLAVGAAFAGLGPAPAVLMVAGWALAVALGVLLSPSLRHPPGLAVALSTEA